MEWPGTIALPRDFHKELVKQVVKSLWHHGFKRFVLLNTHGGNTLSLRIAQYELKEEVPEMKVVYSMFWSPVMGAGARKIVEEELGMPIEKFDLYHGGGFQTSCMMAIEKKYKIDLVDKSKAPPAPRRLSILRSHTGDPIASLPLYGKVFKEYSDGMGVMYRLDESNEEANAEDGRRYLDHIAMHLIKKFKDPNTWLW